MMNEGLSITMLIMFIAIILLWVIPGKTKTTQRTFCYCPNCRHELVSDITSFVEDTDLVRYKCSKCGNKSEWNFDIAPVALVVRSDNGYTDLKQTVSKLS